MSRNRRPSERSSGGDGVTRRRFLTTAGVGAVGLAAGGPVRTAPTDDLPPVVAAGEMTPVVLRINGREHQLLVEPRWSLLYVLRDELGLTGAKEGCHRGECGTCTVLVDGAPHYACMILAPEAEGLEITTLEGLLDGEALGPVQEAFAADDAFQCGYCTAGQIMSVEGLLRANSDPSLEEIRVAVSGNLCRCGAYPNIFKAARRAAGLRRREGGRS